MKELPMTSSFPNPGNGFKIKSRLGGGAWKVAYRASAATGLQDVALLYFHDESLSEELAKEIGNLLRVRKHDYSSYVAEIRGFMRGEDGRSFLIEELILRPLEQLKPLRDISKFARIARDLCRGLSCLHDSGFVHRDLKLDNCGLDRQDRAKIFDLGSVTSEPGDVEATILTRAPELFGRQKKASFRRVSDVWALGATLLALRTGHYPFILSNEIEERRSINEQLLMGAIDRTAAGMRKREIDDRVEARVRDPQSEQSLKETIHANFRGTSERAMSAMLSFDASKREEVKHHALIWADISVQFGAPAQLDENNLGKIEQLVRLLEAANSGEIRFTSHQIERIVDLYNVNKNDIDLDRRAALEESIKAIRAAA